MTEPQTVPKSLVVALVFLGLFLGLWGIRWGLPGRERLERVLPPGLESPAFHRQLSDSWSAMHVELGENMTINPRAWGGGVPGIVEIPAGWKIPPKELLNSYRSFYLRSEHEDEQSTLLALSGMKPRQLQFNPHLFVYGTPHIYSVGAALALGAVTGLVTLKSSILFYLADPAKMAGMYLAGRLVSVAAFIACGLMLLRLGRRYLGLEAGAVAAAIFLMTPAAVVQAHVLKNHMFWAFFALWTVDRCALVLKRGTLKDYAAAGAVAGLTVAAFLGAWTTCFVVGIAGAMRLSGLHEPNGRPQKTLPELKGLLLAGVCALAAFLLINPYWILDFKVAMLEMAVLKSAAKLSFSNPLLFIQNGLRLSATDSIVTLMFGGVALALLKGRREPVLLLCAIVFLSALASTMMFSSVLSARSVRYFLGWLGVGSLLAGRLLQELRTLKGPAGKFATVSSVIVLIGLLCQGMTYSHNYSLGEGVKSTHFKSGEWIDKNVPAGSTIGLLRYPQPSNSPFFRYDRYRLMFIDRVVASTLPFERLPRYLALTLPDYDDRPALAPIMGQYERLAVFARESLFPWVTVDPTATTANPVIEIYRLKERGS